MEQTCPRRRLFVLFPKPIQPSDKVLLNPNPSSYRLRLSYMAWQIGRAWELLPAPAQMVPIFAFISPTFIYSFLEEKVQSSNNYLICVDFPLYAREINTKEISSVVLDCKRHLKIQPISPVSLIPVGSVALSNRNSTLWGKNQPCSQFPEGKLRFGEAEQCGWRSTRLSCALLPGQAGSHGQLLDFHTLQYLLEHKQHRGQSTELSVCSSTQGSK